MDYKLDNVTIHYPSLFEKATYKGKETNYQARFLIDKNDEAQVSAIQEIINDILVENNNKNLNSERVCFRDGSEMEDEQYAGFYLLKASNRYPPNVYELDRTDTTNPDLVYAGCVVNAHVRFWYQSGDYGKRLNATLNAVQFAKHGIRLGGRRNVREHFEDLSVKTTKAEEANTRIPY